MSRATSSDFSYGQGAGLAAPTRDQARRAGVWAAQQALALPVGEQRQALATVLEALGIREASA